MQKEIYPILGDEKELPFYIIGIGIESWQYPVNRPNGYDYPQLFLVTEGEGELACDGEVQKLTSGCVFYLPPHCPHNYHSLSKNKALILNWVAFSGFEAEELIKKWGLDNPVIYTSSGTERLERIMSKAYYTIKSDKLYGNHYASVHLYDMLVEYRRIADNRQSELSAVNTAALADVLEFIENHYADQIKLCRLSEIAGITEQHLCRLFKKNFRMRPMEYLSKVRIQHAKELLIYTNKSIAEIADEVGFPDSSYFAVVFKKLEGFTPMEYRGKD